MDVFNKYRYGAAIMLAATFKNMGNPVASRFDWIQIDEFLQNFRRRNQMNEEATVNGGAVGDGAVWTKRWLKSEAMPDVAVILQRWENKFHFCVYDLRSSCPHCKSPFWCLFPTLLIISVKHQHSEPEQNPISLMSPAISQDALLCTSCRRMAAYVSAIFHTSTTIQQQYHEIKMSLPLS